MAERIVVIITIGIGLACAPRGHPPGDSVIRELSTVEGRVNHMSVTTTPERSTIQRSVDLITAQGDTLFLSLPEDLVAHCRPGSPREGVGGFGLGAEVRVLLRARDVQRAKRERVAVERLEVECK